MTTKFMLLIVLLFQNRLLTAQEFKVTQTKDFSIKVATGGKFIKVSGNFIRYEVDYANLQFLYSNKSKIEKYDIKLTRYNDEMAEVQNMSIDGEGKSLGPFKPSFFSFADKFHILYYRYYDNDIIKLFDAVINPDNLAVEATIELFVLDQKNVSLAKTLKAIETNTIFTKISPDKKHALLCIGASQSFYSCIINEHLEISGNTLIQNPNLTDFNVTTTFLDNHRNKYFSYKYVADKEMRRGILTESDQGETKFQQFTTGQDEYSANDLQFGTLQSADKVYIYGNYYGNYLNEGVLLTTINMKSFLINKPTLYAYPGNLKEQLREIKFADKVKGLVTVRKAYFEMKELDDGTITLTGVPENSSYHHTIEMAGSVTINDAGPLINIFISPDKDAKFVMIPRIQLKNSTSALIVTVRNNSLICLYTDMEQNVNISLHKKPNERYDPANFVLIAAILDSNGNLVSRTKLADKNVNGITFLMEIINGYPLTRF